MALLALVAAPTIFWLWFFYRKDAIHPEPWALVAQIFFFGMLAVIPATVIETFGELIIPYQTSHSIVLIFLFTMLVVGPGEEISKYVIVRWRIWHRPEFDEPVDGIVYAAAGALGFATVENLLYALHYGAGVMLERGPISTLGHVLFAACWGYGLGCAKQLPSGQGAIAIRKGLFWASVAHGAFDFLLLSGQAAPDWLLLEPIAFLLLYRTWGVTMSEVAKALTWRPNPAGSRLDNGPNAKVTG